MPVAEFEQAVARLQAPLHGSGEPRPLADAARYVASIDERGRLVGSLAFDIGTTAAALVPQMPLGRIDAWDGMLRTADGVGETVVFGLPDGRVALRTPGPGTYTCQFACDPKLAGSTDYVLPLVPALATSIGLRLPAGLRPLVLGDAAAAIVAPPPADRPRGAAVNGASTSVRRRRSRSPSRRARCASRGCASGTASSVAVARRNSPPASFPTRRWTAGAIPLRKEPGFEVTRVRPASADAADLDRPAADARRFVIEVPAALAGTTVPIDVFGVAPVESGRQQVVPTVRPSAEQWAGGGITLVVDPDFAVRGTVLEECVIVPPETAVRWPTAPSASIDTALAGGRDGAIPADALRTAVGGGEGDREVRSAGDRARLRPRDDGGGFAGRRPRPGGLRCPRRRGRGLRRRRRGKPRLVHRLRRSGRLACDG